MSAGVSHRGSTTHKATARPPVVSRFDGEEHTKRFWSHYLLVGILVFTGEAVATLVYFLLTPNGPNRAFLVVFTSVVVLALVASIPLTERFAATTWRTQYSFGWTIVAGIVVAVSINLDGGFDSPLFFLLALPIVSAALALEVRQVIVCGVATLGEFTYIWLFDSDVHRLATVIAMFAMTLLGLVVIAVGVSTARSRLLDDEVALRTELSTLATIDTLTGCLNHGAFYERLEIEINRALRQKEPLSLLMIDLDFFKAFNDTYGHLAGDDALRGVGRTLITQSRNFDSVGRVGGDEFAVILPTTGAEDAARIAVRMHVAATSAGRPTMSVGYAQLDTTKSTAEQLVREADRNLYEVKAHDRDRSVITSSLAQSTQGPAARAPAEDEVLAD
jgi:diguanylate cyclase (GGDEF)-like protein